MYQVRYTRVVYTSVLGIGMWTSLGSIEAVPCQPHSGPRLQGVFQAWSPGVTVRIWGSPEAAERFIRLCLPFSLFPIRLGLLPTAPAPGRCLGLLWVGWQRCSWVFKSSSCSPQILGTHRPKRPFPLAPFLPSFPSTTMLEFPPNSTSPALPWWRPCFHKTHSESLSGH